MRRDIKKTQAILELLEVLPWITPLVISKYLDTERWKAEIFSNDKKKNKSLIRSINTVIKLINNGKVKRLHTTRVIYAKSNKSLKLGTDYFPHNQALICFLTNLYMLGYKVACGGFSNRDGGVEDDIAVEIDRGNHTKIDSLKNQIAKYDNQSQIKKILYIVFPKEYVERAEHSQESQLKQMESLMGAFKRMKLPRKTRKKLFFATYIEATNPDYDPLKEKIWYKLDDRVVSVL